MLCAWRRVHVPAFPREGYCRSGGAMGFSTPLYSGPAALILPCCRDPANLAAFNQHTVGNRLRIPGFTLHLDHSPQLYDRNIMMPFLSDKATIARHDF